MACVSVGGRSGRRAWLPVECSWQPRRYRRIIGSAVVFLTLAYCGMVSMLSSAWAICLDVGREWAGSLTGAMNTAGQLGAFTSTVAYGYMVSSFGSYHTPLFPLAAALLAGACLFSRIDPCERIVCEELEVCLDEDLETSEGVVVMRSKIWMLLVIVLCANLAWAQNVSSSVKGVVVDISQAGIPGARVPLRTSPLAEC